MKTFFTSDQHFGDDRMKLFGRPFVDKNKCMDTIIANHNAIVGVNDTVWHLGDFAITPEYIDYAKLLNGKKHLIRGNYDRDIDSVYMKYFGYVGPDYQLDIKHPMTEEVLPLNLVHYPTQGSETTFNVVGHVHGAWRVQKNMVNVGVDVWHYKPVSVEEIFFTYNAINKFYDGDVWVAYAPCNTAFMDRGQKGGAATGTLKI
jgi:calcineurin-like phosphoesterase family protein